MQTNEGKGVFAERMQPFPVFFSGFFGTAEGQRKKNAGISGQKTGRDAGFPGMFFCAIYQKKEVFAFFLEITCKAEKKPIQ